MRPESWLDCLKTLNEPLRLHFVASWTSVVLIPRTSGAPGYNLRDASIKSRFFHSRSHTFFGWLSGRLGFPYRVPLRWIRSLTSIHSL